VESRGLLSRNGWKTGRPAELADVLKIEIIHSDIE
jgi:hypothetical protein